MSVFTFHLVKLGFKTTLRALVKPPQAKHTPGLIHAECMMGMTLGSPILSPSRILMKQLVVFAQWENETAIDTFLKNDNLGKKMAKGWHIRLTFLRQWGFINEFQIPKVVTEIDDPEAPVVAVTLARMRFLQVPRFIRWGRPVEKLVRDHPATSLALAATRLPRTVSTFSIWKSQKEMVSMVHGRSSVVEPKRHSEAMKERERKDFHIYFTTLRFKPIGEYGEWEGRSGFSNFNRS